MAQMLAHLRGGCRSSHAACIAASLSKISRPTSYTKRITPSGSASFSSLSHLSSMTAESGQGGGGGGLDVDRRLLHITEEIQGCLAKGKPVVALESTIISHGMPYPQNLETALEVEGIVRANGATPATICVMDGRLCIGLSPDMLEKLAKEGRTVRKVGVRDLPLVVSMQEHGATTVSATMAIANMVGIKVFVTGGIGGVHRGVEQTWDVSSDLTELRRTPVAVVCAGAKSILDIPRTLEYLETLGVPVIGYQTDFFPAFFSPSSGIKSQCRMDSADQVASFLRAREMLGVCGGSVIGVPIPDEHAAEGLVVEEATQRALQEATQAKISGAEVTPFLLKRVNELTSGLSLKSNIALVKNNAAVGATIAAKLACLEGELPWQATGGVSSGREEEEGGEDMKRVVVIGGCVEDVLATGKAGVRIEMGTSNPGKVTTSSGGVARNIAEAIGRLGGCVHVQLVTVVGEDDAGRGLLEHARLAGVDVSLSSIVKDMRTARYVAVSQGSDGDLCAGVADMEIFDHLTADLIPDTVLDGASMLVLDGNLSNDVLMTLVAKAKMLRVPTLFEPVSLTKCRNILGQDGKILPVDYITPNEEELRSMLLRHPDVWADEAIEHMSAKTLIQQMGLHEEHGVTTAIVTVGAEGVVFSREPGSFESNQVAAAPPIADGNKDVVNTTGCGDSFVGGFVHGIVSGKSKTDSIDLGQRCARAAMLSESAVNPQLAKLIKV